jgi:hypothetical protein
VHGPGGNWVRFVKCGGGRRACYMAAFSDFVLHCVASARLVGSRKLAFVPNFY